MSKADVMKVMKMDKEDMLNKLSRVDAPPTASCILRNYVKELLTTNGFNLDDTSGMYISLSIGSGSAQFTNLEGTNPELYKNMMKAKDNLRVFYAERDSLKAKIETAYKDMERMLLLQGHGALAEIMEDLVGDLKASIIEFTKASNK